MSSMDVLAMETVGDDPQNQSPSKADFQLGGTVPRSEPTGNHGRYRSKDVYLRLENRVYGPLTQHELDELLASGDLTGFESASNDLRTWTPLIYHPRMTLRGQIDPDATHHVLHQRSDLPTASRAASGVDLEALADMEDEEVELPKTPLAAILIKPMKVSRSRGAVLQERVFANLDEESLEEVIERHGIPEVPPVPDEPQAANSHEDTDELQIVVEDSDVRKLSEVVPASADEPATVSEANTEATLFFTPQEPPVPPAEPGSASDMAVTVPSPAVQQEPAMPGGGFVDTPNVPYEAIAPPEPSASDSMPPEMVWPGQEQLEQAEEERIEQELINSGLMEIFDETVDATQRRSNESTRGFFTSELKAVDRETEPDDTQSVGPSRAFIGIAAVIVGVTLAAATYLLVSILI